MSQLIHLSADRASHVVPRPSAATGDSCEPRVYVREARAGMWIVHDECDSKGGCFRDHEAAFQFAEEEFGGNAQIVVQPEFSRESRGTVRHFNQSGSVAYRALATR